MNVLMVSQMGLNSRTGVKTYYINLRDQYIKEGHYVAIVTPQDSPYVIAFFIKIIRKIALFLFRSDYAGLVISEFFSFISIFFAVKKICKAKHWDIIHGQEASSSNSARLALRGKIPVVTTCHYNDSPVAEFQSMFKLTIKQSKKIERWINYNIRRCNNYIFVSNYVYQKSQHLFSNKIEKKVIHNGVSFPKLDIKEESCNAFIISNVGTIEKRKNQILLINTADILAKSKFNFKIWFLGEGPKKEEWKKIAEERGLIDYIVFWGHKQTCLEIVRSSHMYVHTAVNENCSFSITEAFSLGLPVLALNTGGISEQFPASGIGLLNKDITPEELAEIIITYSDCRIRNEMQTAQYTNASKFSITEMTKQTLAFYEYVIANEKQTKQYLTQPI